MSVQRIESGKDGDRMACNLYHSARKAIEQGLITLDSRADRERGIWAWIAQILLAIDPAAAIEICGVDPDGQDRLLATIPMAADVGVIRGRAQPSSLGEPRSFRLLIGGMDPIVGDMTGPDAWLRLPAITSDIATITIEIPVRIDGEGNFRIGPALHHEPIPPAPQLEAEPDRDTVPGESDVIAMLRRCREFVADAYRDNRWAGDREFCREIDALLAGLDPEYEPRTMAGEDR